MNRARDLLVACLVHRGPSLHELLVRLDSDAWVVPTTSVQPGESVLDAARRAVRDQLGFELHWVGARMIVELDDDRVVFVVNTELERDAALAEGSPWTWIAIDTAYELSTGLVEREFLRYHARHARGRHASPEVMPGVRASHVVSMSMWRP